MISRRFVGLMLAAAVAFSGASRGIGYFIAKELAAADPDRDGTLTLDEYLAVVEQRFNAANPDKDGTLDAKELRSPAGRALLRLMK